MSLYKSWPTNFEPWLPLVFLKSWCPPTVIFNSYIIKILLQFTWRNLKKAINLVPKQAPLMGHVSWELLHYTEIIQCILVKYLFLEFAALLGNHKNESGFSFFIQWPINLLGLFNAKVILVEPQWYYLIPNWRG